MHAASGMKARTRRIQNQNLKLPHIVIVIKALFKQCLGHQNSNKDLYVANSVYCVNGGGFLDQLKSEVLLQLANEYTTNAMRTQLASPQSAELNRKALEKAGEIGISCSVAFKDFFKFQNLKVKSFTPEYTSE